MPLIDAERLSDYAHVREVHLAAFPTSLEADLVERLRANGHALISLVAREGDAVVGHVLFSPVAIFPIDGDQQAPLARGPGLAPVAVLPEFQNRGIGGALIETGLARCRESRVPYVVVLGDPAYYVRFGFLPASRYRLANEYGAGDAFQVFLIDRAGVPERGGLVRYRQEFAELA
jgi:putative acetyltransferase